MDATRITEVETRRALECMRRAESLGDSPLLSLPVLGRRLRQAGESTAPARLEVALADLLAELIWQNLARCRGVDPAREPATSLGADQLRALAADFAGRDAERQAWSSLYHRYVFHHGMTEKDIAAAAKPGYDYADRHIRLRLAHGIRALTGILVELARASAVTPTRQHNLPHPLTRFIGREREIGEVRELLARHRLVTLTGPGGIGKSRLAMEVARPLVPDFRDGVWLVDLDPVPDGPRVVPAVAAALEVREQPRRSLTDTLAGFLRDRHLLLILDTCEHVLDACGDLAVQLLDHCRDLQILATSRERLHIAGEAVWAVPPLSLPDQDALQRPLALMHFDSVRLFSDRAAMYLPGFAVTEANAPDVAEVCWALDGIPLATELAAARITIMSARELAERTRDRLDLLHDGRHPGRARHDTVRATIDASYQLLSADQRALFHALAVFAGGMDLAAVTAVCGDRTASGGLEDAPRGADGLVDLLTSLVDKSLVVAGGPPGGARRFRLLETLRVYAREQLEATEGAERMRRRHAAYYLALAEQCDLDLAGRGQTTCLETLDHEQGNIRAALAWASRVGEAEMALRLAGAMARFWELRGQFGEGRQRLLECLVLPGAAARTAHRAKALSGAGSLAEEQGDYAAAEANHREGLAIRREIGDRRGEAESLSGLGNVANLRGDYELAAAMHSEALAIRREIGDAWGIAVSLNNLGNVAEYRGDYPTARSLYEESVAMLRGLGDQWALSATLNNLGLVASDQGDYEAARVHVDESLVIARALNDRQGMAYGLHTLGDLDRRRGDLAGAGTCHAESLRLAREMGDSQGIAESLEAFAFLAEAMDEGERAVQLAAAAYALRDRIGAPPTVGEQPALDALLARLRLALGEDQCDAAWRVGSVMSEAVAVASALGERRAR